MPTLQPTRRALTRACTASLLALPLLLAPVACSSSPTQPLTQSYYSNVTLAVTNTMCSVGPCSPVQVLAFPRNWPATPGGLMYRDVGVVSTPFACLTLPGPGTFGVGTEALQWTLRDSLALAGLPAGASGLSVGPSTGSFVAASAPGWKVSLPGGNTVRAAAACTP